MKTYLVSRAVILVVILALALPTGALAAPPANDDFDNATIIGQFPFNDAISTTEATLAADDPDCFGQSATVWYKFTAAANTTIVANTVGSDYDTTLSVYIGTRGALTLIACDDDTYGTQSFVQFSASAGETYFFMVSHYGSGGSGGSMVLNVNELVPPINDDVDNAIPVSSLPFSDTRDTSGATTAFDDPYCGYRNASVWYAFTPDSNMIVDVDTTGSNYYADVSVWVGTRGAWNYVSCNYSQTARFTAAAGQTYYIMVSTYASGGSLVLSIHGSPTPVNDDADNAIAINSLPFTDTRDTSGATTAGDDPYYCGRNGASVWYSFSPTVNTRIELDTSASSYFAGISVWTGPRGAWSNVNCNYDLNHIRFDALAGQTYYIMIGTYEIGGNLSLSATLAPPPLAIDLSINSIGAVKATTGVVTVKGTVTCNQASFINGWGYVQQKVGTGMIQGYLYFGGNCTPGTAFAWTSTLYSQPVQQIGKGRAATLFTAGKATADLSAFAWSPFSESAYDSAIMQVTLRGAP